MRTYEEQAALILNKVSQYKIAKKKRMRMAQSILVIVVVLVSFTGLALASYTNFDLGRIFNSFFNNPYVEQRIDIGHTAIEGGLEITLLSVFSGNNRAYMMVEVKDVEGKRLSDSMIALSLDNSGLRGEKVVYDDIENKATLILSFDLATDVSEGDVVQFKIDVIFSGFIGELDYIDFDFENHDDDDWLMYFNGNRHEYTILGPWMMSFEVSSMISSKRITAYPTNSQYLAKLEIECSPMATRIDMFSPRSRVVGGDAIDPREVFLNADDTAAIDAWNEYVAEMDAYTRSMRDYVLGFGEPYLTLNDGSTIILEPNTGFSYGFGAGEGQAFYIGDYFDIEELHSITFCGEVYVFDRGIN
jgi:hypothetical protein